MLSKPFREAHKIDGIFGEARSYGLHSGSDWNGTGGGNTDCGYKLYPLKKGEIVHTSYSTTGYGNIVVYKIKGTFGERWVRYCHCREILVRSGQVTPDTMISTLGTSGNSTACHLHWDIIKKPLNNWRTYAKNAQTLIEYFEDPTAFYNKYKDQIEEDDMPEWLETLLREINLTIKDEGAIREIFGKANDYNDKVAELTEQLKSSNERVSEMGLELANYVGKTKKLEDKIFEIQEGLNTSRSERDKATWEKDRLQIENETLREENDSFREKNNIYAYSWFSRLASIFKIK